MMLQTCRILLEARLLPSSLILYRSVRVSLPSAVPRAPLISFPSRRGPDGKRKFCTVLLILSTHPVALINLSLDNLVKGSSVGSGSNQTKSISYDESISVNYGRAPLTEEEISAINVRDESVK